MLAGVSSVFDLKIDMEAVIDREKVNQGYDYSGIGFIFYSAENRTG